ncbi:MAG: glycerol-3-phosphate 1-O-acyltransferase PlsY [Erysipelotrichaceae bacterium]
MILLAIFVGYIIGSIPFALVIGKLFYKTDIRTKGSGNLGGTNAGRVLGKEAGIAVSVLDVVKVLVAVGITTLFAPEYAMFAGVAASFGHCYPLFANFKGGKAVSTLIGFLLGMAVFVVPNIWIFLAPVLCFFITLYFTKMVSLSSMVTSVFATGLVFVITQNAIITLATALLAVLVIYRHRANITRIRKGTESKITWM